NAPCTKVPLGSPVAVYGLKFLVNAGSPEPVITRHWCADAPAERSTAAGLAAVRAVAVRAPTATGTSAAQRVVRRGRRISAVLPFSPGLWALATEFPKAFPEPLPRIHTVCQTCIPAVCEEIYF